MLAIVIPAYKRCFFERMLESLAIQSDTRFNVYIGDDCSPDDLQSVVRKFDGRLNIKYRRFENNLGRNDLIAHWERCLDMIENEDYTCFFSDDDIMEKNCIKEFYNCIGNHPEFDVYHFNIKIISADDSVVSTPPPFPDTIDSRTFFNLLYTERIDARMPEFIFRTQRLKDKGFVNFPRAFRSDNATVIQCASETGIRTISGNDSMIRWRDSGINMSSSKNHEATAGHSEANILFFNWIHRYFKKDYPLNEKSERKWIVNLLAELYPECSRTRLYMKLMNYRPGNIKYKLSALHFLYKTIRNIRKAGKHS